jgi:hypothetical protein
MSDSLFFGLIFFALIISAIGSVVWWVAVIWVGKKVFDAAARDMDGLLPQIESQIRSYQNLPPGQRAAQNGQIMAMMLKANNQMRRSFRTTSRGRA